MIACTQAPAPSLNANAEAKRFVPDPNALTVQVVRGKWSDGGRLEVKADSGPTIEMLPNTMVRKKLEPGPHTVSFEFEGRPQSTTVQGQAGGVRFVRIDGTAWSWKSSFEWVSEPEAATRERALKARPVADVDARDKSGPYFRHEWT